MAIFIATTKSISRSSGQSAVASASYRAGEKLQDERYGKVQDYSKRHGVISANIILPNGLKDKIEISRNELWNMAERSEKRKDSRVAREWIVNLPHELDEQTRKDLAHSFAQKLADKYGVIADCCIHRPTEKEIERGADPRNFHAHIMLTTRQAVLSPDGKIMLGDKATIELSDTKRRSLGLERVSEEITEIRQLWEHTANEKLAEHGHELIDSRSYKSLGIDIEPQIKMGKNATQMERDGIQTPVGDLNRMIKERNELVFSNELSEIEKTNKLADEIIFESRKAHAKPDIVTEPPATPAPQEIKKQREVTAVTEQKPQTVINAPKKPLEKHKEQSARVAPPTPSKAPITPQKTLQQVQAERMATLKHAQQTIDQWEAVLSQKVEAMKSATITKRTNAKDEAIKALDDHLAKKPIFFGLEKWETTKTELENAKEKAEIALAEATGDTPYHLRYAKIEPIDYEKHALAKLDQNPATKAQYEASDKAKAVAQRILEQMANEKAKQHGADIHAKQGVTYHGKVLRADKNGVLQQTSKGIVYHPPLSKVEEGKNYNLKATSNTMYEVQEAMEIKIAQKRQDKNIQR